MNARLICILLFALVAALLPSCEYERMTDQESISPYEQKMPATVPGAMPIDGGEARYRLAPAGSLKNPFEASADSISKGAQNYARFCVPCHGAKYNGDGTVGQSFNPLPADLMSPKVQKMSDETLFRIIGYGSGKSPPLAYTIPVELRWHIVNWIHSLGVREKGDTVIPSGDFPLPEK